MSDQHNFLIGLLVIVIIIYIFYYLVYQNFSVYTSGSLQRYASIFSSTDQRPGSIPANAFNSPLNNPAANSEKELFTKLHGAHPVLNM